MKVWMIWAKENYNGQLWLVDAWDDDSTVENFDGWQEAVAKAKEDIGEAGEIRVVTGFVDLEAIRKSFETADVGSIA